MSDPVITRKVAEAVSNAGGFTRLYHEHPDPAALAADIAGQVLAVQPLTIQTHRRHGVRSTNPECVRWVGKHVAGCEYVLARFEYAIRDALKARAPDTDNDTARRGRWHTPIDNVGLDIEATVSSAVAGLDLRWETTYRAPDNTPVERIVTPWHPFTDLPHHAQKELLASIHQN